MIIAFQKWIGNTLQRQRQRQRHQENNWITNSVLFLGILMTQAFQEWWWIPPSGQPAQPPQPPQHPSPYDHPPKTLNNFSSGKDRKWRETWFWDNLFLFFPLFNLRWAQLYVSLVFEISPVTFGVIQFRISLLNISLVCSEAQKFISSNASQCWGFNLFSSLSLNPMKLELNTWQTGQLLVSYGKAGVARPAHFEMSNVHPLVPRLWVIFHHLGKISSKAQRTWQSSTFVIWTAFMNKILLSGNLLGGYPHFAKTKAQRKGGIPPP